MSFEERSPSFYIPMFKISSSILNSYFSKYKNINYTVRRKKFANDRHFMKQIEGGLAIDITS